MSLCVVVADDSALARKQLIKSFPDDWDVEVVEARNGMEALEAFRDGGDLLFLDLTMPDMDGFQVLATLAEEFSDYRVIVISADVQSQAVERVRELGALDFIGKPASADNLQEVLHRHGIR